MSEFEDSCLKDSVLHPKHAEVYNSVLSTYLCCQQLFPPRYPEASLMALTIPASQDTIKSLSPVTVPPPPVLALGPGLGEWSGCLPGIWTFFREKHRWPISLIQALSKEWLYHSHPSPRLMEPRQMERAWQLRDLPGRGRRGRFLQCPTGVFREEGGLDISWRRVANGDTRMYRERFSYSTHHSAAPLRILRPNCLKIWVEKNRKTSKYPLIQNSLNKLYM